MLDREISSYTPPSKDTVKRDSVPDMQRYTRPGFRIVVYLYLFFVGLLYFLVLLVNPRILSCVRVRTVAGRSRAACRYHTGNIDSHHRNSAWCMGGSILVVLSCVCVQSFGHITCLALSWRWFLEHRRKGGWKITCLKSKFFTHVLEQWLKKYHFSPEVVCTVRK